MDSDRKIKYIVSIWWKLKNRDLKQLNAVSDFTGKELILVWKTQYISVFFKIFSVISVKHRSRNRSQIFSFWDIRTPKCVRTNIFWTSERKDWWRRTLVSIGFPVHFTSRNALLISSWLNWNWRIKRQQLSVPTFSFWPNKLSFLSSHVNKYPV